ncbi:MAG: hypothetical protein MK008_12235 [Bdellovibrionales bacterium]|nr:hypothetical protein [Bdellovibrionales bacterium]
MKIIILIALIFCGQAHADENYMGYDDIVKELSRNSTKQSDIKTTNLDPLEMVRIHTGVGFSSSQLTVQEFNDNDISGFHQGIELNFGIDLFSPVWIAEGTVRSFGSKELENNKISLKEFDLKFVHLTPINYFVNFKFGMGIAARYLTVESQSTDEIVTLNTAPQKVEYSTPSSLFIMGLQTFLTNSVSLGIDIAYRSAMIDETIDKRSIDANLRIDTHF